MTTKKFVPEEKEHLVKRALFGGVFATCLALTFGVTSASAQAKTSASQPASRAPSIWVVGSPDQSFSDQLIATLPAASTTNAVAVVRGLLATAQAGTSPDIPGPALTPAQAVAQLTALTSVLQDRSALTRRQNELHSSSAGGSNITVHPDL